ncbi:hypothetical protein Taro_044490 [Colocasia esculenta]|uniref:DYW domain-containing protein n=1 Tax=Colocasia esculenta TaxID=4460 RepID=A0A843WM35_COLES|nr:hypothetical protein [Colocasia esculenta]
MSSPPLRSHHCASLLRKLTSEATAPDRAQLKKLHCLVLKTIPSRSDPYFSNTLVTFYAKCGLLRHARRVFDGITHPNLFSWNAVLSAYSKSGCVPEMEEIFRRVPHPDGVSWNSLISGYAGSHESARTVVVYKLMLREGRVSPNRITFSKMLMLSSVWLSAKLGRQVHGQVVRFGFERYTFVGSPLVDMYSKVGLIDDARRVFYEMAEKSVVMYNTVITGLLRSGMVDDAKGLFHAMAERDSISWTTLITGLIQNGQEEDAIDLFREMRFRGVAIDQYTFGSVLTACGGLSVLEHGKQIHAYIFRIHYKDNVFVGSALVDMYSKCKSIKYAENVFRKMPLKNVISWTAMLVGYGQNGFSEEAVRIFCEMQRHGVEPDDFTLGSVLSSCANLASLEEGAQFHCQALVSGLISFITVSNAIITLYAKCGSTEDSHQLFDEMSIKDQVSWTALVSGYAQFGKAKETIKLFERMLVEGIKPDGVTFIGVLSACSRAGFVEKGYEFFNTMLKYGIAPVADHYTCMIDLLSRAGRLNEAEKFIKQMSCPPDAIGWATLLSSCRIHGNMEIGKWAAESLLELDPQNPASYVLLANMYAATGKWDKVAELRRGMRVQMVKKDPGCSWIKYKNKVHIFSANDQSSPYSDEIYSKLKWLYRKMMEEGYNPDTGSVLHDVVESEKLHMLSHHSEKLAIAFGLLCIPHDLPIRVVKNLRVCVDCHNATKYISKIAGREILVRDAARFHLFKDGACSCGDFW